MKKLKLNWSQYHKLVQKLAEQIKKSGQQCFIGRDNSEDYILKYKAVYSPDNPMLAFLLSKELGIALWLEFPIQYSFKKEVIVVSDIINTGKTREQYKDYDFACLFIKEFLILTTPVYYVKQTKLQVVMPWEKEIK